MQQSEEEEGEGKPKLGQQQELLHEEPAPSEGTDQ